MKHIETRAQIEYRRIAWLYNKTASLFKPYPHLGYTRRTKEEVHYVAPNKQEVVKAWNKMRMRKKQKGSDKNGRYTGQA